jgi:hypothetical protein
VRTTRCYAIFAVLFFALAVSANAEAATYYVRTDGGPPDRCNGLSDAPAPPSGSGLACAWDHPFRALPPGGTPRIAGGDTLVIGVGSYMMGYGAPGAENCSAGGAWDCFMPPLPSGPDASHPTRILGAGWESGCANPPELWGTERADMVVNLTRTNNAEIGCLAITDHSGCVEFHSGAIPCVRETAPFGPWAVRGIYSEDSSNVFLHDLDVHGLAATGIHAGRLRDWTVQNVKVIGNGSVGWDGDIVGDDSNSGNLVFRRFRVEWNGCGETYPGGQPTGCWAQSAGGYGDGLGTGSTTGNWLFEDSTFLHNTSDGLDLLYAREGSSITLRRVHAEGNAGDQIKTNGPATIENTIAVSNCGSFEGQPFTHNVDPCRAGGTALFLVLRAGAQARVTNTTVTGEGDVLVVAECDSLYSSCNGQERAILRNNIYIGNTEFLSPDDISALAYQETFPQGNQVFDIDYSVVRHVKNADCPGAHHTCGEAAVGLVNEGIDTFDAHLLASSPARDAGTPVGAPSVDFAGRPRDAQPDIGAYEYIAGGGGGTCTLSCSASAPSAGRAGEVLAFTATATPSDCGGGTPSVAWTFGDGQTAAGLSAAHAYAAPGTYPWTMTASLAGVTCARSGALTITAAQAPGAFVYTVPAVTHSPGAAGAVFRTDVAGVSVSDGAASLTLTFTQSGGGSLVRTATIPARGARVFADVLVSLFGHSPDTAVFGTLQIASDASLVVSSRTYNQTANGTLGGSLPGVAAAQGLTPGRTGILPQLRKSAAFRTNIAVVNLGASVVTARIQLRDGSGAPLGAARTLQAASFGLVQENDIFSAVGVSEAAVAYATVETLTTGGRVFAFASVIDNATNDPTLVSLVVPEG